MTEDRITVRIPEACRLIGLGRSKVYELMATGEIETIKVGVSRLILLSSLTAFIEKQRHLANSTAAGSSHTPFT